MSLIMQIVPILTILILVIMIARILFLSAGLMREFLIQPTGFVLGLKKITLIFGPMSKRLQTIKQGYCYISFAWRRKTPSTP